MPPCIIPREEHGISRKQIKPNALRTLYRLRDNGFTAHLVGGCVRDLLMGRSPKDFDIATNAMPNQIKKLFRNCRLVGRRFRLAHLHFDDEILEVSTFRGAVPEHETEIKIDSDSRPPRHLKNEEGMVVRDNNFGTPEEDALRRDFTVNALAYNIADHSLIDFSSGLSDLEQRLIRPIGDPVVRFTEDPVRMLRAVRFAASHDLTIEAGTWETICAMSSTITRSSPERIYEEVLKLFLQGAAAPTFTLLERSGLLAALFPELGQTLHGNDQLIARLHANLEALDERHKIGTPPSPMLFFAVLLGPVLEEMVFAHYTEGVTQRQILEAVCADFMKRLCKTVNVPKRIGLTMSTLFALQPPLQRQPPRKPARFIRNPLLADALDYMRLSAETSDRHRIALNWWEAFLSGAPAAKGPTSRPAAVPKKKRRRRRRRRSGPDIQIAV